MTKAVALPAYTFSLQQSFEAQNFGWSTFDSHYLLYASAGLFHIEVGTRQWLLPPQRAAWIHAQTPVRIRIDRAVACSSVLFAPGTIDAPPFDCRVFTVSALAREMLVYAGRWGRERDPENAAANQFYASLANVCAELAAGQSVYWLPTGESADLTTALTYTLNHLSDSLTFTEIATAAHVSERTLARRFAEETGMTWSQFLRRARLLKAMELLSETERKVIDVAHRVGFNSISAFNHAFREFSGETPSAFRRRL